MGSLLEDRFSEPVTVFHERRLPEPGRPAMLLTEDEVARIETIFADERTALGLEGR